MSQKILDEDIKQKTLKPVYLLYGEETYDIERYVEKIKAVYTNLVLGVNLYILDNSNISDLRDICESVTFFGEEKLVIIKNTSLKFNVKVLDEVDKSGLTICIAESNVDKRTAEYKYLQKNAVCVEFARLTDKTAVSFVIKTLGAYKIQVSQKVAEYMVNTCSKNKQILVNEFRKIVSYLNEGDRLTEAIIDQICVRTIDVKIFDVIDKIVAKRKQEALQGLDDLISSKTYIGVISSMIFKQIKQIYLIKLAEEQSMTGEYVNVAEMFSINSFVYNKLKSVAKYYSTDALETLILEFEQYDIDVKSGKQDAIIGLKRLILTL